jgi:hypothetical protein
VAGGFRIDNDRERLEVEPNQLGCIDRRIAALRDNEGDRLADEADALDRERGPCEHLWHYRKADAGGKAEVGGGENCHDARRFRRGSDIDGPN